MFNSTVIDVAIGLVVVYFVLAVACSAIVEAVAKLLSWRAETLWRAISGLFQNSPQGKSFAKSIYEHDLIDALSEDKPDAKPSYVPAHLFSLALVDHLGMHDADANSPVTTMLDAADVDASIKSTLRPLAASAGSNLDQFRKNIETWFDAAMQRASGWYKRRSQAWIFWIALAMVFAANADTLMITNILWASPASRDQLASTGKHLVESPNATSAQATSAPLVPTTPAWSASDVQKARSQVDSLLGWTGKVESKKYLAQSSDVHAFPHTPAGWLYKFIGLLLTAYAVTLGAPFWFDILKKFVNVRGSGASPSDKAVKGAPVPAQERIPSA